MAQDLKQTISLIFEGVDNTGQAIGGVLKGLDSVTSSTQQAIAPLANFTTSILKTEAALAAAGAALAVFSAAVAQDFERSFREITTLIDQPIDSLQDFRDNILEYAQTSTAGLDEITQSIYSAISAGVDWEQSIEAVAVAERLALAGNADLNEGLEALIPTPGLKAEQDSHLHPDARYIELIVVGSPPALRFHIKGSVQIIDAARKGSPLSAHCKADPSSSFSHV